MTIKENILLEVMMLSESKVDEIYDKFYSDIERKEFDKILKLDPTTIIRNNEITKIGKFSKWLLNLHKKGDDTLLTTLRRYREDKNQIIDALKTYNKDKVRKKLKTNNINQYKSILSLYDDIEQYLDVLNDNEDNSEIFADIKNDLKNGVIEVKGQTSDYVVIVPKTKKMSCKYGAGTRWCTADVEYNAFDTYNSKGDLVILLDKNKNLKPVYQFHFEKNEFEASNKNKINVSDFFDENLDTFKLIRPDLYDSIQNKEELERTEYRFLPKKYRKIYKEYTGLTDEELMVWYEELEDWYEENEGQVLTLNWEEGNTRNYEDESNNNVVFFYNQSEARDYAKEYVQELIEIDIQNGSDRYIKFIDIDENDIINELADEDYYYEIMDEESSDDDLYVHRLAEELYDVGMIDDDEAIDEDYDFEQHISDIARANVKDSIDYYGGAIEYLINEFGTSVQELVNRYGFDIEAAKEDFVTTYGVGESIGMYEVYESNEGHLIYKQN